MTIAWVAPGPRHTPLPPALPRAERVPDPLDACRFLEHHADDVEAYALPFHAGAPRIIACRAPHVLLLLGIHRPFRFPELGARARLHFHEHQVAAVPGHQVDLSPARPRLVIPRHNGAAAAAQVPVRQIFAPSPMVVFEPVASHRVRHAIDQPDHFTTSNSNSMAFPRTT